MAEKTTIGWTHATFNPWVGCQKWSPGCLSCYAAVDTRPRVLRARGLEVWGPPSTTPRERTTSTWGIPMRLHKKALAAGTRTRLFVASLCDIFEDHHQVAPWRAEALALLERCTALDVQLLTKRPENIMSMVPAHWRTAWPSHVWVGTTVEDQRRANERIPHLLAVPARVRFLSCEPLLERVDLERLGLEADHHEKAALSARNGRWGTCVDCPSDGRQLYPERCANTDRFDHKLTKYLSWVIVGGESGHNARPFDLAWARAIAVQCADAGVACFVKQMGDAPLDYGARVRFTAHHGADPSEWPPELRVQEFPQVSP